ncbi:LysR family transcriptional regulator [Parasphingopyxis sp. CP4]|uniref:LysR family transcriptional regulator n=1 Tax=Parasphingopyxis sp. CP4 TaxID=2724527 RepID=UPI0015A1F335|nr:LysR family transcriptional regulator [Parasphingopyxis sp. CP4]QLC22421.1 LysR family transcriptional regulator [Parasphingopyxis sp. CP4]
MLDWNDLRYFLSVARTGSTLAASKQMKVSQSTVSRRITAFEEDIGVKLFVRKPSGYDLTPRGESVLPAAESVEAAILSFSDGIEAESRRLAGTVRLTTVESAANAWVIPAVGLLRERYPEISVEIMTSDQYLDLARGEADIAIRFGPKPTQETLIVRHLIDMLESFYASEQLVAQIGMPEDIPDMARYPLVSSLDGESSTSRWVAERVPGATIAQRASTLSSIIASVQSGLGASILPCLMGDDIKGLVRLMPPIEELTTPGWMVTTDEARRQPHIRAVIDFVVEQIQLSLARRPTHLSVVQAA